MFLSYLLVPTVNVYLLENEVIIYVAFFLVHLSPHVDLGFRSPLMLALFKFVFIDPILSCKPKLVESMTMRRYSLVGSKRHGLT